MGANAQTLSDVGITIRMRRGHIGLLLRRGSDVIICRLVWADGLRCLQHLFGKMMKVEKDNEL